jgi:hypothetical protein
MKPGIRVTLKEGEFEVVLFVKPRLKNEQMLTF